MPREKLDEHHGNERNAENTPHCPMCDRPLESISDYPRIIIKDLIIAPIPGVVHTPFSEENIAPAVKDFFIMKSVRNYLTALSATRGNIIDLENIKPKLEEHKRYKGFYKLLGKFYMGISNSPQVENEARVMIYKRENIKGDWYFQEIASLAKIKYVGVLNSPRLET